jgi:hypothetical protein
MDWADVPVKALAWYRRLGKRAKVLFGIAQHSLLNKSAGVYLNPEKDLNKVGVYSEDVESRDFFIDHLKRYYPKKSHFIKLAYSDLEDPHGTWVKVGYSKTLREIGETLNFLPGQFFGVIPNYPSPLTAMLTTGLLGAGLGYGTGKLMKLISPDGWGANLPITAALLGGALGALPGAGWMAYNVSQGLPLNDSSLFSGDPVLLEEPRPPITEWDRIVLEAQREKAGSDLEVVPLSSDFLRLSVRVKEAFDTIGMEEVVNNRGVGDVNLNELGQVLWRSGASPQLTAATMGTLYAAQQMPDINSRPGVVTAQQLGTFAAQAGSNYITGSLTGSLINSLIGSPYTKHQYGLGVAGLGILSKAIPNLFN